MEEERQDAKACMISDLKELEKLLKLCRKQGVSDIKFGALSIVFGELPRKPLKEGDADEDDTGGPTDEELAFFSAGGGP